MLVSPRTMLGAGPWGFRARKPPTARSAFRHKLSVAARVSWLPLKSKPILKVSFIMPRFRPLTSGPNKRRFYRGARGKAMHKVPPFFLPTKQPGWYQPGCNTQTPPLTFGTTPSGHARPPPRRSPCRQSRARIAESGQPAARKAAIVARPGPSPGASPGRFLRRQRSWI